MPFHQCREYSGVRAIGLIAYWAASAPRLLRVAGYHKNYRSDG